MKLTVAVDPRRGMLRVQADDVTDYPIDRVALRVSEAAHRALYQLADEALPAQTEPDADKDQRPDKENRPDETGEVAEHAAARDLPPVPQQRRTPDDDGPGRGAAAERNESVTRRRALRLLDQGHTVEQTATRLGVDPELLARWDDDAATDAHTDLLADACGWPHTAAAS